MYSDHKYKKIKGFVFVISLLNVHNDKGITQSMSVAPYNTGVLTIPSVHVC